MVLLEMWNLTPEYAEKPEYKLDIDGYSEKSISYVHRRLVSAGMFLYMHQTLAVAASTFYPYQNTQNSELHSNQLLERYTSVLLGYDHPYLVSERPGKQNFLNPLKIVPFLYRHLKDLLLEKPAEIERNERHFVHSPSFNGVCAAAPCSQISSITVYPIPAR